MIPINEHVNIYKPPCFVNQRWHFAQQQNTIYTYK